MSTQPTPTRIRIVPRAPFAPYLARSQRWACMVVHRRAGKTYTCCQDLLGKSQTHTRAGEPLRYAYIAPTRDQAKDIAWPYIKRFFGAVPGAKINEAELSVTTPRVIAPNSASIRLYSGDNYERMRGLYLDGVVIDEEADIPPAAWNEVIRPALADYQGWATFIGTPKGRNHFWRRWCAACESPEWFTLMLRASESGLLAPAELASMRKEMTAEAIEQELECSFAVQRPGAIYATHVESARSEGRISPKVDWYRDKPVFAAFDVGAARNQKVWIFQLVGDRLNFLASLSGDEQCATPGAWMTRFRQLPYDLATIYIPHDAAAEHGGLWQSGFADAGMRHVVPVPRQVDVWDGINLAVTAFPRCWFQAEGCADGIEALDAYHSKEEKDGVTIQDRPVHDWSSHYSDAFSLCHQAIKWGLVYDRTVLSKGRQHGAGIKVITGFRGI